MFHVVFLVKKADAMSPEEFGRYWIEKHTPLTAKAPGARTDQCYVATGAPDGDPAYDGVAVLAFDDEAAYRLAVESPEFAAAIADAPNFQNTALTMTVYAEGHTIV
ncbi:MAG: EthD family reductase [Thermomicrobiales bacterium]